jgi:hypothetical protein
VLDSLPELLLSQPSFIVANAHAQRRGQNNPAPLT